MTRYLTVEDVAEMLLTHPETVREWSRRGTLVGFRAGARVLFDPADVEAFVARRKAERVGAA